MKTPFVTKAQIEEIVKTYPTPFHIYDEKGIRENARKLKQAFAWNKGYKEYFAVKATPNPTILKILKEEDYVRLVPESFHNYMDYQEEGCVYELPWEYECAEDDDLPLTKEQYHAIVSIAKWLPEERISLK